MMRKIKLSVLLVLGFFMVSCASGPQVGADSIVEVEYTGTLKDGKQFDTNVGKKPLGFIIGKGQVLPAFEKQIMGMRKDQKKKFTLKAKDAYGVVDPEKVVEMDRNAQKFPKDLDLKPGVFITATQQGPNGQPIQFPVKVVGVTDDKVKLDYNHPLAGQDLTYEVKVVNIMSTDGAQPVKVTPEQVEQLKKQAAAAKAKQS